MDYINSGNLNTDCDHTTEENILETLAYFHIFGYPLTYFEIKKFLFFKNKKIRIYNFDEINLCIEKLKKKNLIIENKGFYTLRLDNAEEFSASRMRKSRLAETKHGKALRIINILKYIPTIKMIGICNSLSYNNAGEKSDIDLFIITAEKKIWLTRLAVLTILKILKIRPTNSDSKDKICASFFISEHSLNLENLSISTEEKISFDICLIFWIASIAPIYNPLNFYEKFIAENLWINKFIPQWHPSGVGGRKTAEGKFFRKLAYPFFALFSEKLAKKIQIFLMPDHLKEMANKSTKVVINQNILKFHDKDKRKIFFDKWSETAALILKKNYENIR